MPHTLRKVLLTLRYRTLDVVWVKDPRYVLVIVIALRTKRSWYVKPIVVVVVFT